MTLEIDLPPELEDQLAHRAAQRGQTLADYALTVLKQNAREPEARAITGEGGERHTSAPGARRPEGLAEGSVIVGPKFDETLPRELLARFGL